MAQLSAPIKTALTGHKFNATTYKEMFKKADEAYLANGGQTSIPAVVGAVEAPSNPPTTDSQIAAVSTRGARGGRGRGQRGGRGGRGNGRGNQNNSSSYNNNGNRNQNQNSSSDNSNSNQKPHQKGQKHSDLPSNASWACAQHWKKGRGAPYCSDPLVCEWSQVVAPRN